MKDLDRNTIENAGVLSLVLMERAALKTVEEMKKRWKQEDREKVLVVCGSGNNGGDGLADCKAASSSGHFSQFLFPGKRRKDDTGNLQNRWRLHEITKCHRCIT